MKEFDDMIVSLIFVKITCKHENVVANKVYAYFEEKGEMPEMHLQNFEKL